VKADWTLSLWPLIALADARAHRENGRKDGYDALDLGCLPSGSSRLDAP
jgi:hypothetical protein